MQSENDKALCQLIAPLSTAIQAGQEGPFPDDKVWTEHYRRMIDGLGTLKRDTTEPTAAAYYGHVEIRPGLFAGVSVPFGPGPFPVVLHAHGNGFLAGGIPDYKSDNMDFAHGGFVTVVPAYRLAPEYPFPAGFDDMMAAAAWIASDIHKYGGDPTRIVITGNSVGGGFGYAIARALMATPMRDSIRGAAGFCGFYDWRGRSTQSLTGMYLAHDMTLVNDPRVSVAADLKAGMLPPNLALFTGSADFACLATLTFAQVLRRENIEYSLHLLEGNFHDAERFPDLDGGREVIRLFLEFAHRACATAA
jgi:acetyl esterase/lipase